MQMPLSMCNEVLWLLGHSTRNFKHSTDIVDMAKNQNIELKDASRAGGTAEFSAINFLFSP